MNYTILKQACIALVAAATISSFSITSAEAGETKLKKGDRIVFLGDSITQAGVRPKGYVTLVRNAIAKKHGVEVIGAGISGHKVPDCQKRLDRDVISKKPSIVFIYIGINDVWHWNRNRGTTKEDFEKGLHDLIDRSKSAGARVVLCTPSVIGEKTDGSNKFDKMLDEYSAISRKVAEATKSQLLDLRKLFVTHLKENNKENKERSVLTSDGVHLNEAGNRFVANSVLTALGAEKLNPGKVLRHVVMFQFKETSTEKDIKKIVDAFAALPKKIKEIHDFEYGTDVSVEGKAAGFTHCFLVTFKDEKGREIYLPHPAHKEFVSIVGPHVANVLVFDYWSKE